MTEDFIGKNNVNETIKSLFVMAKFYQRRQGTLQICSSSWNYKFMNDEAIYAKGEVL